MKTHTELLESRPFLQSLAGRAVVCLALAAGAMLQSPAAAQAPRGGTDQQSQELAIRKFVAGEKAYHVVSTLIVGPTESILFDAQYRVGDAKRLADWIADTGTKLKAVILSHADHDHYMGGMEILKRFPGTPFYMTKSGLNDFAERAPGSFSYEKRNGPPLEVPDSLVTPQILPDLRLQVDGLEVVVLDNLTGDAPIAASTALWIPSLKTVLAGDLVFEGIHVWLGAADHASRVAWRESLRRLAELHPLAVIPGHKRDVSIPDRPEQIDFMVRYLDDYDAAMSAAADPDEVAQAMVEKYPDLAHPGLMAYGARQMFKK